ncbi:SGNH/GDSL hydrolase family protein [Nonomuraea sp. NBC_01738]|uniref:SGNH/GDSL hydrolase family protein n=1 Tax=Nonomuraea sp. NBC_01738 TaxID=2976003 RepID=UPI002E12E4A8|nr:SGNH/GDSL hydrolase family protein [Nonomuraea sp. NBC_01738]
MLLPLILAAGLVTAPVNGFHEYVALGDSWSADVSLIHLTTEYVPSGCVQSSRNYPKQVAAALGVATFRDATCGGATTAHMTAAQDVTRVKRILDGVNKPQFDRLTPTTDLVTLGIGGNDARLAAAVGDCVNLLPTLTILPGKVLPAPFGAPCKTKWVKDGVDQMSANIKATEPKVAAAVAGIRQRSPRARILLVDYLAGLPETGGCFPYVQITDLDMDWLAAKLRELNAMLARVARDTGVTLVDTYSTSKGHDVCQLPGKKWVEGVLPLSADPVGPAIPFHPNQLGADHQARTVLDLLGAAKT